MRVARRFGAVGNPRFGEDVAHMGGNRIRTYDKCIRNLAIRLTASQQSQHVDLSSRQPNARECDARRARLPSSSHTFQPHLSSPKTAVHVRGRAELPFG